MTNLIYKGFTEVDKPAQFVTVVNKHGFEMITGFYSAANGLNVDNLSIGHTYQMNIVNNEVTL